MSDQLSSDLAALKIDRAQDPGRKSPLRALLWVALLLGAAGAAYVFGKPYLEAKVFKREVEVTEVLLVSPAQSGTELTATGYVLPQSTANVAPKVPGRVARSYVKQGDTIKQGDTLFELELSEQNAAIATAQSRVASARAQVQTARANLLETQQQANRAVELSKTGSMARSSADDLLARVASLTAALKAAEAQTFAAQKEVEALRVNSGNFVVAAPISGRIINKPPEPGELVGPAMSGVVSQLGGVEIADFSTLQVETDVPEQRLHRVSIGAPCEITLDAFPDKRYRGKVTEVSPRVNRAKASVTVKVRFVDDPAGVLPDMAARVSFLSKEIDAEAIKEKPKLVVPSAAVVTRPGGKYVFVVESGRVRLTPVSLGPPLAGGFVLISGAAAGTKVVSGPPADLANGQSIKEKGGEA